MWCAILENINFLELINKQDGLNFDYVLRFRTDIICKDGLSFLSNELKNLKDNEVLFPSNLHWKGLNDSFFITSYNTILKFDNFFLFLEKFIKDMRVFDPEYILYSFINENNLKIKLINDFNLALIRIEEAKPTKQVYVPLKDKIKIKIAKQKIKLLRLQNKIRFIFR